MSTIIEATFDGNVFHPTGSVPLLPNTLMRLIVETMSTAKAPSNSFSFLQTACELKIEGPPDWASSLDQYLYGKE